MGLTKMQGKPNVAPIYYCSITGKASWSGLSEELFDDELIADLFEFIYREAYRQGYNDSSQNRVGENLTFFHESFFNGWASELWTKCYYGGVEEHKALKK